jgi:hypothetical protein
MFQLRAVQIFIGDLQQCLGIVAIRGIDADSKAAVITAANGSDGNR